jgi:hypothetical protein
MNKTLKYKLNQNIINIIGRYNSIHKDNEDKNYCLLDLIDSTCLIEMTLDIKNTGKIKRFYYHDGEFDDHRYYWTISF